MRRQSGADSPSRARTLRLVAAAACTAVVAAVALTSGTTDDVRDAGASARGDVAPTGRKATDATVRREIDDDNSPRSGSGGGDSESQMRRIDHRGKRLPDTRWRDAFVMEPGENRHRHMFSMPRDIVFVKTETRCDSHDVDHYVAWGIAQADAEDWELEVDGGDGDEHDSVTRWNREDMGEGSVVVDVVYDRSDEWDEDGTVTDDAEPISYSLLVHAVPRKVDGKLRAGERVEGTLAPINGHVRNYRVLVPTSKKRLRLDLIDGTQDIDLMVAVGAEPLDYGKYDERKTSDFCNESVTVDVSGVPIRNGARNVFVTVIDQLAVEQVVPFTLVTSTSTEPPAELSRLYKPAEPRSDIERTALSVVRVDLDDSYGSGVVIDERGIVATAEHVVGPVGTEILVSLTTDFAAPPTECYRGRVIRSDEELDAALVRIERTLDDKPLPPDHRFVAAKPRWSERATLGEAAFLCGFHDYDDSTRREPVSWTAGVVSGYDFVRTRTLLRIDALVASGSSGGAVFDADHRWMGTIVLMNGGGPTEGEAVIVPVPEYPEDWSELDDAGRR